MAINNQNNRRLQQQEQRKQRPQRPSDIQRKSSRQSSEFYRSTSQISHEQAASNKLVKGNDGSSSASAMIMKEEQQLKVVDHQQIDSSDYENDEDGQYEEVGDDYDEDENEDMTAAVPHAANGGNRRSSLLHMQELKENVKETDGEDDEYSDDAD